MSTHFRCGSRRGRGLVTTRMDGFGFGLRVKSATMTRDTEENLAWGQPTDKWVISAVKGRHPPNIVMSTVDVHMYTVRMTNQSLENSFDLSVKLLFTQTAGRPLNKHNPVKKSIGVLDLVSSFLRNPLICCAAALSGLHPVLACTLSLYPPPPQHETFQVV
jgi:hypothetical protein